MNRRSFLSLTTLTLGALTVGAALSSAQAGEWVRLYNGQDLSGWHVIRGTMAPWKANGEMISFAGKGGGCLATEKEYGDFELRFEYRYPKGGNTGLGLRFPRTGWPSTDGMEIQILDDEDPRYGNLKPEHKHASIYTHVAPKARPFKPVGEWNKMEVRCQGPLIVIRVNDVEVQNVNLDELANSYGKGKLPIAKRPRRGLIGFPSHGDPVDFRNIEIREL